MRKQETITCCTYHPTARWKHKACKTHMSVREYDLRKQHPMLESAAKV